MERHKARSAVLLAICVAAALAGPVPRARAGIDASGPWWVGLLIGPDFVAGCRATFTQDGADLSAAFSCGLTPPLMTGGIDSVTGAFTVRGIDSGLCGAEVAVSGTVAPDGRSFTGGFECFNPLYPGVLPLEGSRCGNGVLDQGEGCDDGDRLDGDCCSASCTLEPAGSPCDEGNPCRVSTCDGAGSCDFVPIEGTCEDSNPCTTNEVCVDGNCVRQVLPDGSSCDDRNLCTAGEACSGGRCRGGAPVECGPCETCNRRVGCRARRSFSCLISTPGRSTLRLRDDPRDRQNTVTWKLIPDAPVWALDFGDPRSETSYDLCVFEGSGAGRLLAGLEVPAGGTCGGKPCWTPRRDGYEYVDKSGAQGGTRRVTLKAGAARKLKLAVKARGRSLDLATLPASLPVLVELKASHGACWGASFFDAKRNDPIELRATTGSVSGALLLD